MAYVAGRGRDCRYSGSMSRQDTDLVRKAFEGDLVTTARAYWHPEIEYTEDPRFPGASSYKGRDEVVRVFQSYTEILGDEDDIAVSVEDVVDAGERQVPIVRFKGSTRTSGIPFEHLWGYVVEVRDERIVSFRAYYEPREALEAVGVSR
jgi:ketosteroid isomerase-like protein